MEYSYKLTDSELKELLEAKVEQYNQPNFIEDDPISIPHQFTKKQDIEIIGLIISLIAWGKRMMIINNGEKLLNIMDHSPYDFVMNYDPSYLSEIKFVHRTFNTDDLDFLLRGLQAWYKEHDSLESMFYLNPDENGVKHRIFNFRTELFKTDHQQRSEKHIANPMKGSAAKRLNMYLRWMVRKDNKGVDFGLWNEISMSELCIPLDVHTGRIAKELGILKRKQNDWKALEEIMDKLRKFDPIDPAKYDFALFGLGVNKEI